jgi:Cof subfamily protein (haloacid dehalogenase superfamily)
MAAPGKPSDAISLVIADVDGTLVTEQKVLTPRAQAAVRALGQAGVKFAITSGRPPRGMAMLIEPLALTTPIAGFNGGMFVQPDMSVIATQRLEPGLARQAIDLLLAGGLDAWVYAGNDWLVRDPSAPHVAREEWTVKFPPRVVAGFGDTLDRAVKIVGVSDDYDLVARVEREMQQAVAGRASATRSQPYYLDVTHPLANKGNVVRTLSRRLRIPQAEIVTIGDMPNDVLMFRESGLSIAMGNARPEVKDEAHFATDDYNNEGFANAIERFVLPRVRHGRQAAR